MAEGEKLPAVMLSLPVVVDPEVHQKKMSEMRALFKEKYADKISSGAYDPRDLERFTNDDDYAKCFLTTAKVKGDVEKGAVSVNEVFDFRKEMGIWDWTDETFPQSLWDRKPAFYHGQDRKGHPLLHVRTKEQTAKTPEEKDQSKRFLAWQFEKYHREKAGKERCVVILDMAEAGIANMSMDASKYVVRLFQLFPSFTIYVLNFEMPWLLSAVWKAICLFLNEEQKSRLIVVGKKEIKQYIADEHLLDHQK